MSMTKQKDTETNDNTNEYKLFSEVPNLLKYREQVVTDANHHSNEFVSTVKYYTTLISALFSLQITITIACVKLFIDNSISIYLFLSIILIPFVLISLIIIFLCRFALDNSERLYRNTMEYVSIKMKIDELLGIHNQNYYCNLMKKSRLKLFRGDTTFANSRWEEDYQKYGCYNISSGEFVNNKIKDEDTGYKIFSRVFETFMIIGYIFVIISLTIAIIVILPFLCQFFC